MLQKVVLVLATVLAAALFTTGTQLIAPSPASASAGTCAEGEYISTFWNCEACGPGECEGSYTNRCRVCKPPFGCYTQSETGGVACGACDGAPCNGGGGDDDPGPLE